MYGRTEAEEIVAKLQRHLTVSIKTLGVFLQNIYTQSILERWQSSSYPKTYALPSCSLCAAVCMEIDQTPLCPVCNNDTFPSVLCLHLQCQRLRVYKIQSFSLSFDHICGNICGQLVWNLSVMFGWKISTLFTCVITCFLVWIFFIFHTFLLLFSQLHVSLLLRIERNIVLSVKKIYVLSDYHFILLCSG